MSQRFSDYIIYADESGDHSLESVDPNYPIFVLVFCIFNKYQYSENVIPSIQKFKFKHFGHDLVLLHEREIKKAEKDFVILINENIRHTFIEELTEIINSSPFTIISLIIKKDSLRETYSDPTNPYHLALKFGLERIYGFLRKNHQQKYKTHIIFESRGGKEDRDLELEFRRVCGGDNKWGPLPFEIIFAKKNANSCGLQLADLVARPIGRHILDLTQENRAYKTIENKIYCCDTSGKKEGWGLKCFP